VDLNFKTTFLIYGHFYVPPLVVFVDFPILARLLIVASKLACGTNDFSNRLISSLSTTEYWRLHLPQLTMCGKTQRRRHVCWRH